MNIIYITGYGRSGSTFLDRKFGAYDGVVSCGEIEVINRIKNLGAQKCSCNIELAQCEFWSSVIRHAEFRQNDTLAILDIIESVLGKDATIIDSSKTAYGQMFRPYYIRKQGHAVIPVHVWRNPCDVIRSRAAARARRKIDALHDTVTFTQCVTGLVGWTIANLAGLFITCVHAGKVFGFDRLINEQNDNDIKNLIEKTRIRYGASTMSGEHLVAGNRMRNRTLASGPGLDSRPKLPNSYVWFVHVFTLPLVAILRKQSA